MIDATQLIAHWHATWSAQTGRADEALGVRLLAGYAESHRRYHTVQHLAECLGFFALTRTACRHPAEIATALWFHDAIYDTRRHDNEDRCADWASTELGRAGVADPVIERVAGLVLATKHATAPQDPDAQLLVDIDLAIFGADEPRFTEYERQIREEYAWVPDPVFRQKRGEILAGFLARPKLYLTAAVGATREAPARANLRRAISALENEQP